MSFHHVIRTLLAGSVLLFLAACASGEYALQVNLAGEMERDRILTGTMAVGAGAKEVQLSEVDGGMECNGVALIGYAIPGCASSGSLRLECADGRTVTGDWDIEECRTGQGTGSDSLGNTVSFLIGDAVGSHARRAQADEPVFGRSSTGIMLFLVGGGYAAGFDLQPDALRAQGWQVVFASKESDLVIVESTNETVRDEPIVLATSLPQEDSEVFIVTNDGILASSITTDTAGAITISQVTPLADGLPVLNESGEVIGLTRSRNDELQLFDSRRLRRYLALLDPQLADIDATRVSVVQLRERIIAFPAN